MKKTRYWTKYKKIQFLTFFQHFCLIRLYHAFSIRSPFPIMTVFLTVAISFNFAIALYSPSVRLYTFRETFDVMIANIAERYLTLMTLHAHAPDLAGSRGGGRHTQPLSSYTSSRRQVYGYPSHLQLVALLLARGISAIPRGTHAACVHTYLRLR